MNKWKQVELERLLQQFHETLHKVTDHSDEIDHATQLQSDKKILSANFTVT